MREPPCVYFVIPWDTEERERVAYRPDLRDTPGADLRGDVVVHLVCVHLSDCEEVH